MDQSASLGVPVDGESCLPLFVARGGSRIHRLAGSEDLAMVFFRMTDGYEATDSSPSICQELVLPGAVVVGHCKHTYRAFLVVTIRTDTA